MRKDELRALGGQLHPAVGSRFAADIERGYQEFTQFFVQAYREKTADQGEVRQFAEEFLTEYGHYWESSRSRTKI